MCQVLIPALITLQADCNAQLSLQLSHWSLWKWLLIFFYFFVPLVKWQKNAYLNHLCTLNFCTLPLISSSNLFLVLMTLEDRAVALVKLNSFMLYSAAFAVSLPLKLLFHADLQGIKAAVFTLSGKKKTNTPCASLYLYGNLFRVYTMKLHLEAHLRALPLWNE